MIQVRLVGRHALGPCQRDGCAETVELSREHCCGGGPGGGRWGCGKYLCAEHLPHVLVEYRPTTSAFPKPPREWRLCDDCWRAQEDADAGQDPVESVVLRASGPPDEDEWEGW